MNYGWSFNETQFQEFGTKRISLFKVRFNNHEKVISTYKKCVLLKEILLTINYLDCNKLSYDPVSEASYCLYKKAFQAISNE